MGIDVVTATRIVFFLIRILRGGDRATWRARVMTDLSLSFFSLFSGTDYLSVVNPSEGTVLFLDLSFFSQRVAEKR